MKNILNKIGKYITKKLHLFSVITHFKKTFCFFDKYFKKRTDKGRRHSEDYKIYLRHMKNMTGTLCERWTKVLNVIIDPMVILPILLGLGFLIGYNYVIDEFIKSILFFISAFGIGIGVNHFSTTFRDQTEYRQLVDKAEHTVRMLNSKVISILLKDNLIKEDKEMIYGLIDIMDYWKDYYEKSDSSRIAYHNKLKNEIEKEVDPDKRKNKKTELDNIELKMLEDGLTSYISLSGSTAYNYFNQKDK